MKGVSATYKNAHSKVVVASDMGQCFKLPDQLDMVAH
jgi:hypothetical protein